ncbi:MAG TPA: hypothetical protein VF981_16515, partial [Gemmatimonadaceae bacterium]
MTVEEAITQAYEAAQRWKGIECHDNPCNDRCVEGSRLVLAQLEAIAETARVELCAKGGHCWIEDGAVVLTMPPTFLRHCKHCKARQAG